MRVKLTFFEELLGTASSNPDVHAEYIASKAPTKEAEKEEVDAVELLEKSITIFPKENGKPFVWDYQIKGFFKDACGMLKRVPGTKSSALKAYKKVIDGLIFPRPRKIFVELNGEMGECQRPLRGQTAQGERIALAHSETIPEGSSIEFDIKLFDEKHKPLVEEWLKYGELRGLGQWRNSGKGRFTYEVMP